MPRNLLISYDLHEPGQNYDAVIERIKELGTWAKIHYSLWYVRSSYTPTAAVEHIEPALDANDRVFVAEAVDAAWNKLPKKVGDFIQLHWRS